MSSTRRPARDPKDDKFYTPPWVVDTLGSIMPAYMSCWTRSIRALDPAAGNGAIIRGLMERTSLPIVRFDAVEIRDEEAPALNAIQAGAVMSSDFVHDFDSIVDRGPWDLVVTNPPYSLALPFAFRGRLALSPGGVLAMLLRLGFLGSAARQDFLRAHPPDVWVLSRRPSFTPNGKTDSDVYAWFIWAQGWSQDGIPKTIAPHPCGAVGVIPC